MYKTRRKQQKGKTRALFRKTGDIKGTFCPKMGTIKDINRRDLVDAEESKESWKELHKRCPNEPDDYTMVCSASQSQTFWRVKSSGPEEALLLIKLVDSMKFQ